MERRQFARIKVNLMLKFKSLEAFEGMVTGSAGDLSRGGMYIRTPNVRKVGTGVEIELPVPGRDNVLIRGIVRSIRYESDSPCGMGIQFDGMDDRAQAVINYLLAKDAWKAGGGSKA